MKLKRFTAGLILLFLPFLVSAQGYLLENPPSDETVIGVKFFRPNFDGDDSYLIFSGLWELSAQIPIGSRFGLVGSLPIPYRTDGGVSDSGQGNVFAGVRYRFGSGKTSQKGIIVGAYLPTASKNETDAMEHGIVSNYTRFHRLVPYTLTFSAVYTYSRSFAGRYTVGYEGGVDLMTFTGAKRGNDPELLIRYGVFGARRIGNYMLRIETAGVGIVTGNVTEYARRFTHALVIGLQRRKGEFRPGVFYKLYLDDRLGEEINNVFGISLELVMPKKKR